MTTPSTGRWRLPAFSDDPLSRLVMGTLLYLAQGIPQGVVFIAIPIWLAARGQSTAVIGAAVTAASLPWMLKVAAGAAMDRYTWLPMGRRRPWLIGSQALIAFGLVLFALLAPPVTATVLVLGFTFAISALTAVQDTALDALVIDLTPEEEQGRINGFMFGGKLFGIAAGSAVTGNLMEHHGIAPAMLASLVLFAIPALAAILIRERPGEKMLPWTRGHASPAAEVVAPDAWWPVLRLAFVTLLRRDTLLVIGLLILYGVHQTLYEKGIELFAIRRLGWGEGAVNNLGAVANIVFGAASLFLGGAVIDRLGPRRTAVVSGVASLVTILAWPLMPEWWDNSTYFIVWSFVSGMPVTLFYLTYLVLAMRASVAEVAATSFALIAATSALGVAIGGPLLAYFETMGGFNAIFAAAALLVFVAGLLPLFGTRHLGKVSPSADTIAVAGKPIAHESVQSSSARHDASLSP